MNALLAALFASALIYIQCYISGTRLAFSLPAYGLIALAGVLAFFAKRDPRFRVSKLCLITTVICFAYMLARAWCSPVEYLARSDYYLMLGCLVTYGLTTIYLTDRTTRLGILTAACILVTAEAFVGGWQFAHKDDWMPFGLLRPGSEWRASGVFISSIHFAGFLEALAPFALAIAFWGTRRWWLRIMGVVVAFLSYAGVVISGSRGGWISAVLSLLVLLGLGLDVVRRSRREHFKLTLYVTLLALLLISAAGYYVTQKSQPIRQRMELLTNLSYSDLAAYDIRIHNWQAALDQWREAPWLGTGAGTHLYYGRKHRRPELQSDPEHAHSDYLELLAEYGIVGAALFLPFLLAHARAGLRGYRRLTAIRREDPYHASPELALNVGALVALSAYIAHSVVDFNLHLPGNALFFSFIFGVLAQPGTPPPERDESELKPVPVRMPWRLVLPILSAWLAVSGLPKYPGEYWCEKARVAVRDRRNQEAIEFAQRGLASESRNPYLYFHLGRAQRALGRNAGRTHGDPLLRAAEKAFRDALALYRDEEEFWIRLGQTLDGLRKFTEARAAYLEAIRLDPNLGVLYGYFANHLISVGRVAEAEEVLARGQRLSDKDLKQLLAEPIQGQ